MWTVECGNSYFQENAGKMQEGSSCAARAALATKRKTANLQAGGVDYEHLFGIN
jgi:hypothetical protein